LPQCSIPATVVAPRRGKQRNPAQSYTITVFRRSASSKTAEAVRQWHEPCTTMGCSFGKRDPTGEELFDSRSNIKGENLGALGKAAYGHKSFYGPTDEEA
jgi:hypothetical protein